MSDAIVTSMPSPDAQPPSSAISLAAPRRSLLAQIVGETFVRWGARLGLVWIAAMVVAAVFAPLIANSHPFVMRDGAGDWSSPMLEHLTIADVLLLLAAVAAAAIFPWRAIPTRDKALLFIGAMGLLTLAGLWHGTIWPFMESGHTGWFEALEKWRVYVPAAEPVDPAAAEAVAEAADAPKFPMGGILWWMICWVMLVAGVGLTGLVLVATLRSERAPRVAQVLVLVVAAILGAVFIVKPVAPPPNVVYAAYREAKAADNVQFALYAPVRFSPSDRLRDQPNMRNTAPSRAHLMGTTINGADLFSNMVYATRIALAIGFIATGIAMTIGVVVGGLMGYFAGWVDLIGMRLVEIFSSIPTLILLLAFVAVFEVNLYFMMAIIGLTTWVSYALFIRAEFFKLRRQDFVQAARAMGLPLRSILFRHMLPNGIAPVLVTASFGVAGAILFESTLSFLGIGLVEESSWGKLLNQALGVGGFHWWIALYPGLAIFLTVFAYNLIGEALRDAIDPHLKKASQL